jgi:hypothetical protein
MDHLNLADGKAGEEAKFAEVLTFVQSDRVHSLLYLSPTSKKVSPISYRMLTVAMVTVPAQAVAVAAVTPAVTIQELLI